MTEQDAGVAQALREILEGNGKGFMSLSAVKAKMKAPLRRQLGITDKMTGPSIKMKLEPYLGEELEVWKGDRISYLVIRADPKELVFQSVAAKPGKTPGILLSGMPFTRQNFLTYINELLKEGRLLANVAYKSKAYTMSLSVVEGTGRAPQGFDAEATPTPAFADRRGEFRAAFDDLDRGKIFVRICELRRKLGWPREDFDEQLRRLRDEEVIQLHTGDVTSMTPEDVRDCFIDENGFRMGTVTWHGKR